MENKQSLFDENEISINEFVFFLKIVLINKKTNQRSTFVCNEVLIRNDFNLRAEQTFQVEDHESDDEQTTPRNQTSDDDSRPKTRRGRDQQQTDDDRSKYLETTESIRSKSNFSNRFNGKSGRTIQRLVSQFSTRRRLKPKIIVFFLFLFSL